VVIREAAAVVLLRRAEPGFEVLLVRRSRGASFMASSYVFPGGAAEPGEDARAAAARELFEEAGVLFARGGPPASTLEMVSQDKLRKLVLAGNPAALVLETAGLAWALDALAPWSHWITPSIEPKRFSARFFVAELPPGQTPTFDATETVDQTWLAPRDAAARAGELALPPPQLRTLWELAQHATIAEVVAAARKRAAEPHPIMPRLAPAEQPCLLLPWDPDYTITGTGDATPLTYRPSWASGPSRFVMEDRTWKHVDAPRSTTAG
jgi:8-oxo-dGTP pyrophosphatase MutT (NUDIX family)